MQNGIFITGTDTGVGKTTVSAALAFALRRKELPFSYLKPVESGIPDRLYLEERSDAAMVKKAGGLTQALTEIAPFTFREALSPLLAARREGRELSGQMISDWVKKRLEPTRLTLVEGAGGLLAPLCPDYLVLDLIKELKLPVLVVCRSSLGAVNHTLLTLERLRREGLNLVGLIINHLNPTPGIAEEFFLSQLQEFDSVTILGEVPYFENRPASPRDYRKIADTIMVDKLLELLKIAVKAIP
ncbi:MAG: dethiobiotin synthase [Deltaproteobacteria bacterium]|nr:dethiobiotin synthase [Deltaproteobacteria bacterium]